ncbi:non-ribosomal peptide synthetase [uncultured Clostridium sp.]|uniref:non-ribosomal peptide synthetase n=1 Tax=uncultured Clostridium sp. TaxID=59620 RepID=UPI0025CEFA26|nr:non-ribosomal peptide synthetase [uncultured Clostridium sp.]
MESINKDKLSGDLFWKERRSSSENIFPVNNINLCEKKELSKLKTNLKNKNRIIEITNNNDISMEAMMLAAMKMTVYSYADEEKIFIPIKSNGRIRNSLIYIKKSSKMVDILKGTLEELIDMQKYSSYYERDEKEEKTIFLFKEELENEYPHIALQIDDDLNLTWFYNKSVYSDEYIEVLNSSYEFYINTMIFSINDNVEQCRLRFNEEVIKKSSYIMGKKVEIPQKTIIEFVYDNMNKYPDKIAVIDGNREITYKDLWELSNGVANELIKKNVMKNDRVALKVSNSIETVACIMGILKIGAAYVPFDHKYPVDRQKYIIETSKAKSVVGIDKNIIPEIQYIQIDFTDMNKAEVKLGQEQDSTCYIMYTSGSTGKPKGAEIKAGQLLNLCIWYSDVFKINENSRVMALHSFAFDTSFKNVFTPLIKGGTAVINLDNEYDFRKINKHISKNKCTHIQCTSSIFNTVLTEAKESNYEDLETVKVYNIAGEDFFGDNIPELYKKHDNELMIFNAYGATEATDFSSSYLLSENEIQNLKDIKNIPIGIPMYNHNLYVMSRNQFLCEKEIPGEIYIGGIGVSSGYVNNEERNRISFSEDIIKGDRTYKTGDCGYWNKSGNLMFNGRKDNQIKLNGFRIELAEIERTIEKFSEIEKSRVIIDKKNIVAFFTTKNGESVDIEKLKDYLSKWLPTFMQPRNLIKVDKFTLNANGKIDLKELEKILHDSKKSNNSIEMNSIEEKICSIWRKILEVDYVDIDDNFFDLGGNSLNLFKLSKEIEKELDIKIKPIDFMELTTVAMISDYIENGIGNEDIKESDDKNSKRRRAANAFRKNRNS